MAYSHNVNETLFIVDGSPRLYALPPGVVVDDPSEGIPVDVYDLIAPLFEGASSEFWKELVQAFWDRGLIRKEDFLAPDGHKKIRQALNQVYKHDVLSILAALREDDR